MNVVYDGHIFRWQRVGGIVRYFSEIIKRLPPTWAPTVYGALRTDPLPYHPQLARASLSGLPPRRYTQPLRTMQWESTFIRRAKIFHPTYYNLSGGMRFNVVRCPVVITAHDFIAARYPKLEPNSSETIRLQREAFAQAAHIICISRYTESDLLTLFPSASGKTSVIYHGSSFIANGAHQDSKIFESPTFLYVGGRNTYKNFPFLLRAFAKACSVNRRLRLQIAGPPLTPDESWQIHFLGISSNVFSCHYPNEEALHELYRNSVALLYPSRHEGFGIPPLEAMACGTLAITANTTSLPEVVGDGGILLDPSDENAWTECMLSVAAQTVDRHAYINNGSRRADFLSWKRSSEDHIRLYNSLL